MSSWLKNHKKGELLDLAEEAGLELEKNLKKDEIASQLEDYLKGNASSLSSNSALSNYYKRQSPVKKENAEPGTIVKPRRRQTKSPTETLEAEIEKTVASARKSVAATPRRTSTVVAKLGLPATPKEVSDLVERQTSAISRRWNTAVERSGFDDYLTNSRELLSSVHAIHLLFILVEAWGLQAETLPWTKAFQYTVPFAQTLGLDSPRWATYPNFFVLLEESFWAPTLLWLFISLILPLVSGWAVNLTRQSTVSSKRAYPVDPVAFNITKALLAWAVHGRGLRFGIFSDVTQARVETSMPTGSYNGVLVETAIGAFAGLYEAVLKK